MNYTLFDFLKLVGSLGMFLYGMKIMSEALQRVSGAKLRSILSAMTANRYLGALTGFLVTAVIQSSSATTVMVVSFVNAGLITLSESIGVIMGANIGTTVTGWIISVLGFKFSISQFVLPLIGLGLPLVFSKNTQRRSIGEIMIGFTLLFLGLDYLKNSMPDIDSNPEILIFLERYTGNGFRSVLLFLGVGTILTFLVQSSSATMALTFVMVNQGWISFELAAAMVLGENIGTTITANIAASVGNLSARRAAFVHSFFNILGAIWMLCVFRYFTQGIGFLTEHITGQSPFDTPQVVPIALSLFHTSFNLINTFIFIWFVPQLHSLVMKILPQKQEEEEFRLQYITTGLMSTPELSLLQARREAQFFAKHTIKMFGFVEKLFDEKSDKKFSKLFARIQKYENISDDVEVEIANYLSEIAQGKLSDFGRRRMRSLLELVSDLESIGDSNYNLARNINRMYDNKIALPDEVINKLKLMFNMVRDALDIMHENLGKDEKLVTMTKASDKENEINNYRNQLKAEHLEYIRTGFYSYEAGIIFNDLFSECEKLADYIINVTEALDEVK
ncbi:MAG: Na/Pi cotransporter family protein [Prolixibacteraceae bacterium]|nr:Na/Pi cotransporter family protein [Prolixibacteraceae bacterium]